MSEENKVTCDYCGSRNVNHRDADVIREFPGCWIHADYYTCESCGRYFHKETVYYEEKTGKGRRE